MIVSHTGKAYEREERVTEVLQDMEHCNCFVTQGQPLTPAIESRCQYAPVCFVTALCLYVFFWPVAYLALCANGEEDIIASRHWQLTESVIGNM